MARSKGEGSLQRERNGIWTIRYTENGVRRARTTGETDRAAAERFLAKWLRGEPPSAIRIDEAWERYAASPYRRDLAKATLEGKRQSWRHFIKWLGAVFPRIRDIDQVTPEAAEAFLRHLRTEHSASTYNGRLCVLREIFRIVLKEARIHTTPFDGIPMRRDDSHTRRELTLDEVRRLLFAADHEPVRKEPGGSPHTPLYMLFSIGIYTGLRLGDCACLEWKSIDLKRGIVQLVPRKTKRYMHNRPVTIPIHPTLAALLAETPEAERAGPVLPSVAARYHESRPKLSYDLKRVFKRAGIVTSVSIEGRRWKAPEATFHSLRHTFVSLSANAGVPLHVVQSIVGHSNAAMTRHYYHESEAALRAAVAAIPAIT